MPEPVTRPSGAAIVLVLLSSASVQVGATVAKQTFPVVGPLGMLWLRLVGASLVLLLATAATRAHRRRHPSATPAQAHQWMPLLAYAVCLVGMNAAVYQALARLPVGIAVTLEFLGPLTVGVLGSRHARDLLWPVLALAGVALLGITPTPLDPLGVAFALVAAACWGGYILTAAKVGESWSAIDALLLSCLIGAAVVTAPALHNSGASLWAVPVLLVGLGVGLLSTAIPYSLEIVALKKLPTRVFGILMSLEPAVAALAALILLGERLSGTDLVAMACVISASIGATRSSA